MGRAGRQLRPESDYLLPRLGSKQTLPEGTPAEAARNFGERLEVRQFFGFRHQNHHHYRCRLAIQRFKLEAPRQNRHTQDQLGQAGHGSMRYSNPGLHSSGDAVFASEEATVTFVC